MALTENTAPRDETVESFSLLLVPGFSLMTFASFLEPLRQVNRLLGRALYEWHLLSVDGRPEEWMWKTQSKPTYAPSLGKTGMP